MLTQFNPVRMKTEFLLMDHPRHVARGITNMVSVPPLGQDEKNFTRRNSANMSFPAEKMFCIWTEQISTPAQCSPPP